MTDWWLIDVFYVHNSCFMPTLARCSRANSSSQVDDDCTARLLSVSYAGTAPTERAMRSQSER